MQVGRVKCKIAWPWRKDEMPHYRWPRFGVQKVMGFCFEAWIRMGCEAPEWLAASDYNHVDHVSAQINGGTLFEQLFMVSMYTKNNAWCGTH